MRLISISFLKMQVTGNQSSKKLKSHFSIIVMRIRLESVIFASKFGNDIAVDPQHYGGCVIIHLLEY